VEGRHDRPERGRIATEALLSRDPRPTAILAFSDQLTLGAIEAARHFGLSVPKDLSVVGFDDVPEATRATPPLTTVHQPHVDKGLLAGRNLLAQLREEEPSSLELLPTHLVVHDSADGVLT
jgi:DNA-binding LacI/PurR family transcriptional regulator